MTRSKDKPNLTMEIIDLSVAKVLRKYCGRNARALHANQKKVFLEIMREIEALTEASEAARKTFDG